MRWIRVAFVTFAKKFNLIGKDMGAIQIFSNPQFGAVRAVEIENNPYFVGRDIAKALGYIRPNDAITQHCRCYIKHRISDNQGVPHDYFIISEGNKERTNLFCQ